MSTHGDISLDYNYLLSEAVGTEQGLTVQEIEEGFPEIMQIQKGLQDLHRLGQLPFQELPYREEEAEQLIAEANRFRDRCDYIVVLGIGGSGLGPACLAQALARKELKRFFVVDNIDPIIWEEITEQINIKKTLLIVISKSGKTVETLAAFSYFRKKLIQALGETDFQKNVVIITDPDSGPLRQIAKQEKILSFAIPPGVGGRYSVLSPVGLFPAACIEIDIQSLLAGACRMDERCQGNDLWVNPVYLSGLLNFLMITLRKKTVRIAMPYTELLDAYTEWFCRLWGESLGKQKNLKGESVNLGQTPVRTMGATDQHSQLQLYLDGPKDKVITFLTVRETSGAIIPNSYDHIPEIQALEGKTVEFLMDIEHRATEEALRKAGVPSMTLTLPHLNADCLGQLFHLATMETVVTGELFNINPFNQPAVESIKNYIKGLLGIKGFEKYQKEIETSPKNKRYII